MLLVFEPGSLVFCAVGVLVDTLSFGLIIDPLALIDITIAVDELTLAVGFIIAPLSFVSAAIRPELLANAVAHTVKPLSCVSGSVPQSEWSLLNSTVFINLLAFAVIILADRACHAVVS